MAGGKHQWTRHSGLKGVFRDAYNPMTPRMQEVHQVNAEFCEKANGTHGTAVCGIIHQLAPLCPLIPISYHKNDSGLVCAALDYAVRKSKIITC